MKLKAFFLLDKPRRFALQTVVLTAGLLITQLIWDDYRFFMVLILSIVSYILTAWSLSEDIKGVEWVSLFILPVLFTASVSLFYFLLPGRWITRLIITIIFAIGTYAIIKAENIYNVAVERSIPLLRVAQTSGLVISLIVVFFISNIVFSLRVTFFQSMMIIIPIIFLLSLQSLWSIKLETKISRELIIYSFVASIGVGELVTALSFWPVQIAMAALLTSSIYYAIIGVIQQYFLERLFVNSIKEYIFAFLFTLIITFIATQWG